MSLHWKTDLLCLLLRWRVAVCFWECVAPMAVFLLMQVAPRGREWSSLTGERRGKRGVTLQPPSTPCSWAHSVMKWPVSWRPYPNNGPIQPGEESLSGLGWIRYLWFRAAVPLSFDLTIFYSVYCSCYHPLLFFSLFRFVLLILCFLVLSFLLPRMSAYRNKYVKKLHKELETHSVLMYMFLKDITCHCLHVWVNIIRVSTEAILVLYITVLYFMLLRVFGVSFVLNSSGACLFSVGLNCPIRIILFNFTRFLQLAPKDCFTPLVLCYNQKIGTWWRPKVLCLSGELVDDIWSHIW